MSADKRTVTTDALETLGKIIGPNEKRDAIHLAVDNVIAAHVLRPGEDVGFMEDGTVGICPNPVGIVDPFLKNLVRAGERFWLVVYPRQITSLRHVWEHPAFPSAPETVGEAPRTYNPANIRPYRSVLKYQDPAQSEAWLREWCANADCPGYETVMEVIKSGRTADGRLDDEYMHFNDMNAHGEIPYEFWDHVEIVLGHPIQLKPTYFSCSC